LSDNLETDEDPSWRFYPETLLEFLNVEGGIVIDLRRSVTDAERHLLRSLGPSPVFAVITASNPVGVLASQGENDARLEQLRERLKRNSFPHARVDGVSPDRNHREEGFAVWLPRDAAMSLAVDLEQSAFFWFDGDSFWLIGALVGAPPAALPRDSATQG
jgi:hypothetical protein